MDIALNTDFEALHEQFEAVRRDTSTLKLKIAPTYACNCRCAYCYEQDKATQKSLMGPAVEAAIHEFVEARFAEQRFGTLEVEWYGGEPTLALELIERMSARFIAWCGERGVEYVARGLSNGVRIGPSEAALLARCRVESLLLTIDGPEDVHNARRPAVDADNPYRNIMGAIEALQAEGITCYCIMNTDKVNASRYAEVAQPLFERFGITLMTTRLVDYAHTFDCAGCGSFKRPEFDLYTHGEFAQMKFEEFREQGGTELDFQTMLAPCPNFCWGQRDNYFVIDPVGDVYKCDGWMGDPARSIFNLLCDEPVLDAITFDPFEHDDCATCELLSICWGNCSWERERDGWPCHPLKTTLPLYLQLFDDRS